MKYHVLLFTLILSLECSALHGEEWHTFEDLKGRKLVAKVVVVQAGYARVLRQSDSRVVTIPFSMLVESDREYLRNWKPQPIKYNKLKEPQEKIEVEARSSMYPRTKVEIKRR